MKPEIKVGLTVLFALLLLYFLVAWGTNSGLWAASTQTYRVHFQNVDGLLEGDPVEVRGYTYGKVLEIRPMAEYVEVEIVLGNGLSLFEDARAEIQVKELMGGKQITLTPGVSGKLKDPSAPILGEKGPDFASTFSAFGKLAGSMEFDQINRVIARFDTLSANLLEMSRAIPPDRIEGIFAILESSGKDLEATMRELRNRKLVGTLDTALHQFNQLATTADASLKHINHLLERVDDKTLDRADSMLLRFDGVLGQVEATLATTQILLGQFQDTTVLAGKLLFDPSTAMLLDSTLYNLNQTLDHIRTKKVHVAMSLSHKNKKFEE